MQALSWASQAAPRPPRRLTRRLGSGERRGGAGAAGASEVAEVAAVLAAWTLLPQHGRANGEAAQARAGGSGGGAVAVTRWDGRGHGAVGTTGVPSWAPLSRTCRCC